LVLNTIKQLLVIQSLYQLELAQVEEEEEPKEGEESKPEVKNRVFPIVGIALFFLNLDLMY
jgi:hypothetical protein